MSEKNGAGGVYAKVQKVSADLEEIPKTGYNEHFGYKYHEADRVMAELRPLLAEHGLVIIPHQVGIEDVAVTTSNGEAFLTTVKHELEVVDTEDGSNLTFTVFGRGQDSSDKGPTKAYTMAYKYGVMKLFGIASSQSDPDAGAPSNSGGRTLQGEASEKQVGFIKGLLSDKQVPDSVRERIEGKIAEWEDDRSELGKQQASDVIEKLQSQPDREEDEDLPVEGGKATSSFDCPECGDTIQPGMKACDGCGWLIGGPPADAEQGDFTEEVGGE